MIQRLIIYFVFFISVISCNNNDKAKDLIPKNQVIDIVTDIHLAEGALKIYEIYPDSIQKKAPIYYATVYKKHHVNEKQFKDSYEYYYKNPAELEKMMDKVTEILSKKESGIEEEKEVN